MPRIAGATMEVVAGTGHLSMLEKPSDVAQLVRTFVDGLNGKKS
jgi:pimeloyl-ACP methyl ester carboxylesterase